jgi:hypothetical protein
METIYKLPNWAETTLVICVAMMLAGLASYLACKAITEAVNAASRLETKRSTSNTRALNKWQRLYEDEHKLRADDNAQLISEILSLQCENKRMKELLGKVKVADL